MSSFRITITELKPRSSTAETIPPTPAVEESKVFEQTVDNINVSSLIRQINSTPRRRKGKNAQG